MATKLASKSEYLYKRARELIPGGVNSPVRYYSPYPLFVASAKGSRFRTVDGEEFLDYCMAYGALLDGHAYEEVVEAVQKALARGSLYGQPTEMEVELASLISSLVPSMEMVRLVNSGTEATMHSLRLARAFTGRQKILKFEGGYHGAHDSVLVRAGSGASNLGIPNSEGIPKNVAEDTLVAKFNDEEMSRRIIEDHTHELAAVIIEPVMGNMGPILPGHASVTETESGTVVPEVGKDGRTSAEGNERPDRVREGGSASKRVVIYVSDLLHRPSRHRLRLGEKIGHN